MRTIGVLRAIAVVAVLAGAATPVVAQEPATREAAIEQEQAEKATHLNPYVPDKAEALLNKVEDIMVNSVPSWHPFFNSAYSGGGFPFGVGYAHAVSPYNTFDVRGSYTISGYKRVEAEFLAPRLLHRRATLSLLGGWREATQASFYGLGGDTSRTNHTNYDFQQPYGSATFTFWPTRRLWMMSGGVELTRWEQRPGHDNYPSVEAVYTPETLPGLGARVTYLHSRGTIGFDWRTSPGYARRGGFYGITFHDYTDRDQQFGFEQVDYEAVQHFPILREAWVISLHGLVQNTFEKQDQQVPFFMLPSLGSGSTLRGFDTHRFRDQNSLLLQAEWRIMVNRFIDTAVFYDAGKVAATRSDLDFNRLKTNYGIGVRFHGPLATFLRVDLARSREELQVVFAASALF
jgi:hypothetical protein